MWLGASSLAQIPTVELRFYMNAMRDQWDQGPRHYLSYVSSLLAFTSKIRDCTLNISELARNKITPFTNVIFNVSVQILKVN